ncbi:unnamed protein product [Polarella glacialis]|uniref:Uncharacterized protein n=1 Tax=Polarella glacialis TaxID=89957 RepID=A0A813GXG1_POLGL|nr:unnamed protein product [Polarella glacialis]
MLLPFMESGLRRPVGCTLWATDATPTAAGATQTTVAPELAQVLFACAEQRGEHVRLDWSGLELPSERQSAHAAEIDQLIDALPWHITASYSFKETYHIDLQEAKALVREVKALVETGSHTSCRQVVFCDSCVCVGAFNKGRSSSFRLNQIIRSAIPCYLVGDMCIALTWDSTGSNPADHPSRGACLPPSKSLPGWAKRWFPGTPRGRWGLELFAGSCRLTSAFRALGLPVLTPVEISMGFDVMSDLVDQLILTDEMGWIWSSPPCCSFSPLRHLDKYGPLRPKGHPEGDSSTFEVWLGNRLWLRSLYLVKLAWTKGAFCVLSIP